MLPRFPRFDFEGALDMSKRTYRLHRIFMRKLPKVRDARDAMLLEWKGPYGDYLYEHSLENDLENHSIVRGLEDYAYGWIDMWRNMVNKTNAISYYQAMHHQRAWSGGHGPSFHGGTSAWENESQPPIEPRVVDGRFLEAPHWNPYLGEQIYGVRAPHAPDRPPYARPPVQFGPAEPPFVYYELDGIRWDAIYSYQVPIPAPDNHGAGPRPRQVLPLRPWNLPEAQGSSYGNRIDLALTEEYLRTSRQQLVALRQELNDLEEHWRAFERRSECERGSDGLKYFHMVISEMWRTRRFVKKVHQHLLNGDTLGSFDIPMPEWRSTPGARRGPSWDHRGARFGDLAAEAGLKDRDGDPIYEDPDIDRYIRALDEDHRRLREQDRRDEANAEALEAERANTEELLAFLADKSANEGTGSAQPSEATEDLVMAAAPNVAAAPAVAQSPQGRPVAGSDPTDEGWFPAIDASAVAYF